jgi:hypothetical protein
MLAMAGIRFQIFGDDGTIPTGKVFTRRPFASDFCNDRAVSLERHTAFCFAAPKGCGKAFRFPRIKAA